MNRWLGIGAALILSVGACDPGGNARLVEPDGLSLAKGGNGGGTDGDNLIVDIVAGDFAGDNLVLSAPGCSGDSESGYNVTFGNTDQGTNRGCLSITTSDGTQLVDDLYFTIGRKSGASTRVTFWGRDAAGPGGILHESDPAPVNPAARLSAQGFTIHVHKTDLPVWRLSGHLSSKRVAQVGTVDIGDLVYHLP